MLQALRPPKLTCLILTVCPQLDMRDLNIVRPQLGRRDLNIARPLILTY